MEKYTLSMRVVHWIMSLLIIILLGVGLWMTGLPNDYPGKYDYYALHKSFGVVALVLVLLRLSIRMRSQIPALPKKIIKFDANLSKITILVLYICMFAMPLSGYLMSNFAGYPVPFFGMELPSFVEKNPDVAKFFREVHGYAGYTLIVMILLHVAGSVKHLAVEKVNLFRRMW